MLGPVLRSTPEDLDLYSTREVNPKFDSPSRTTPWAHYANSSSSQFLKLRRKMYPLGKMGGRACERLGSLLSATIPGLYIKILGIDKRGIVLIYAVSM